MPADRLRSIVPMFGGASQYVESLNAVLKFVVTHHPSTDELVGWHRGSFANVSSRDSILRRVSYLENVGFLQRVGDEWRLGDAGREYTAEHDTEILLRIMCERNVGLRSLLYALSAGSLTIAEISEQQLDTHPELGWSRGETDMAKQRANWLRSMGLVETRGDEYVLTDDGWEFVGHAVGEWRDAEWTSTAGDQEFHAGTYETTVVARTVDPEFRATVLSRYDGMCPVSGVDHAALLDVAHVLPWSEFPEHRADVRNVVPLSKTHHAAFDRELFTIDREFRLRVNPSFETRSDVLQRTIIDRAGEYFPRLDDALNPEYVVQHNATLEWV
ncbi:putative restriction endonuclease [Halogranum gelatinilyticum]|uniref:Putative restriction endonuclease n=2 Tax=Halogranum gelatinilyticum TaxID=660521 RepID=A0A1G9Z2E5_9EURY|nr:putative restriction endonuclease [Halogranum gelatinilyticum]